jgi:hypothetical protein
MVLLLLGTFLIDIYPMCKANLLLHHAFIVITRSKYKVKVQGIKYKLQGTRYKVQSTGYKVQGTGYKVQGTKYKVKSTSTKYA